MRLHPNYKSSFWEARIENLSDAEISEYTDLLDPHAFYRKIVVYRDDDEREREFVFFVSEDPIHIIRASYMTARGQIRKPRVNQPPINSIHDMAYAYVQLQWKYPNGKGTSYSISKAKLLEIAFHKDIEVTS
tara:strand:+ start:112 stop:507 length:396 start_codon:yes stop_codon:yes gene_type:complete